MLYDEINNRLKQAMREKDTMVMESLRSIKSRLSEYLIQHGLDRNVVSDNTIINVLIANKKSLNKAINQLSLAVDGKADSLINEYKAEIKICEEYLPSESQIFMQLDNIVSQAIMDLNVSDKKQMGRIIGYIMKNNKGLDGNIVKKLVLEKLKDISND